MADKKEKETPAPKGFLGSKRHLLLVLLLGISSYFILFGFHCNFLGQFFTGMEKSANASGTDTRKSIKVAVNEFAWSEEVRVPSPFSASAPGWLEYKFTDGSVRYVKDRSTVDLGNFPGNSFRLRGKAGTVVIDF